MDLERSRNDFALTAYRILLAFSWRLVGDRWTAEDITQAAFAAVLGQPGFDPNRRPAALKYLKQKASWLVQDHYRRLGRKAEALPAELADPSSSPPELALEREESRTQMQLAVAGLSVNHREVVVRHLAGRDHEQIAADLGLPIAVVYRRFHAAKAALRRLLEGAARA